MLLQARLDGQNLQIGDMIEMAVGNKDGVRQTVLVTTISTQRTVAAVN